MGLFHRGSYFFWSRRDPIFKIWTKGLLLGSGCGVLCRTRILGCLGEREITRVRALGRGISTFPWGLKVIIGKTKTALSTSASFIVGDAFFDAR